RVIRVPTGSVVWRVLVFAVFAVGILTADLQINFWPWLGGYGDYLPVFVPVAIAGALYVGRRYGESSLMQGRESRLVLALLAAFCCTAVYAGIEARTHRPSLVVGGLFIAGLIASLALRGRSVRIEATRSVTVAGVLSLSLLALLALGARARYALA